jgi:hypothetical protein
VIDQSTLKKLVLPISSERDVPPRRFNWSAAANTSAWSLAS